MSNRKVTRVSPTTALIVIVAALAHVCYWAWLLHNGNPAMWVK